MLSVKEPYGDLPSLSDIFNQIDENHFMPFSCLRCNMFGEPEM
jgi:hypothetical protein